MKVVTVVGARPQFVKAAPVTLELRKRHTEILVHTGQHYDSEMSEVFFAELNIPAPTHNLEVGSGLHGSQTAGMLAKTEQVLLDHQPDWVLVYGDTNSTLAGALAAAKLHIRVAHVEAGLRSFNRAMPEEINRIVTDHVSSLLFCPSETAVANLATEGITRGVHLVGDVMAAALASAVPRARERSDILRQFGLSDRAYILATVHRAENTDDVARLHNIFQAFCALDEIVVVPLHPRTRRIIERDPAVRSILQSKAAANLKLIAPLGYLDMVRLELSARMILTDSGGIQKEAYWLGVPCVTLRDETEWIETVQTGWNVMAGTNRESIIAAVQSLSVPATRPPLYGEGSGVSRLVSLLESEQ